MSWVLVEQDPFALETAITALTHTPPAVRRPLLGTGRKGASDIFAYLELKAESGSSEIDNSSESGGTNSKTANFILSEIHSERAEHTQLVSTFGDTYVLFFGARPVVLAVTGILLDTDLFNWYEEFSKNYDERLRGTACVENKCRVLLFADHEVWSGYILGFSSPRVQMSLGGRHFTLSMIVMDHMHLTRIGNLVDTESGLVTEWGELPAGDLEYISGAPSVINPRIIPEGSQPNAWSPDKPAMLDAMERGGTYQINPGPLT